jgi:MFS family permease
VRRWRAFALLAVAYFMTAVDLTIVNVALPTIGRKLHFSETDLRRGGTRRLSPSSGTR